MKAEFSTGRVILHLVTAGFPAAKREELERPSPETADSIEILPLTEANSREALEKIFAADTIAVWGKV